VYTLSGEVYNLSQQFTTLSGDVYTLSGEVYNLSQQFTTLSSDVYTLSGEVYNLSQQFTTLSGDVYTLSGEVYNLSQQFTTLSGDVYTLSAGFYDLSAKVYDFSISFTTSNLTVTQSATISAAHIENTLTVSGNAFVQGTLSATEVRAGNDGLVSETNIAGGGNLAVLSNIVAGGNLVVPNVNLTTINNQPYPLPLVIPDPLSVNVLNVSSNATLAGIYVSGTDISGFTTFYGMDAYFFTQSQTLAIGPTVGNEFSNSVILGAQAGRPPASKGGTIEDVIAIGYQAADSNAASKVIALGPNAAVSVAGTGTRTIAIGFDSVGHLNSGPDLIALGVSNTATSNTGTGVIALGGTAVYQNTGDYVIALGCNAGYGNSGDRAIFLGSNPDTETLNTLNDRFIVYSTDSIPFLHGDLSNKQLGIGTTTLSGALTTSGNVFIRGGLTATNLAVFQTDISVWGSVYAGSGSVYVGSVKLSEPEAGSLTISGNVVIDGSLTASQVTTLSTTIIQQYLSVSESVTTNYLTVSQNATICGQLIYHGFDTLSGAVYTLSSEVNTLSGDVYNLSTGFYDLSTQFTTLSGDVYNLSSFAHTNISDISGILQGYSTSFTTVDLTVTGTANISALTISHAFTAPVVNTSDLNVTNINGNAFYPAFGTKILRVAIDGCDAIAALPQNRYSYPFSTISQAITSASAGDAIDILAGTFYESNLILKDSIALRGANTQSTFITTSQAASNSTFMFQMGSNTRLEDMTISLNTGGNVPGQTYSVVTISGTNIISTKLRTMVMNMNHNSSLGNAAAILVTGDIPNPTTVTSASTIRAATINLNASGVVGNSAYNNCVRMAGNSRFSARDTMFFLYGSNCSGASLIGCETVSAGVIDLQTSTVSVSASTLNNSTAEISQTHSNSTIILAYTNIVNKYANSNGFTLAQTPFNILYGAYGNNVKGSNINNTYMNAGTVVITSLGTTSGESIPYTVQQDALAHDFYFRTNTANDPGSNITALLYSNDPVASNVFATLTISGTDTIASNDSTSVRIPEGQSIYVQLSSSYGDSASLPMTRFVVDIGLF
jgi:hypothetical protein